MNMKQSSAKYIIRIDDVCPTMNWELFTAITDACDELEITPVLGVVPDNQDPALIASKPYGLFWEYIKKKTESGYLIAQHGYQHTYLQNKKTEFAGLSYQDQYEKIQKGQEILLEKLGFKPTWWMAPAHSFDNTTCSILKKLGFQHITDGVALYPYKKYGLTWVPQQIWRPRVMPFGTWTICLHTNTMSIQDIQDIIIFMRNHADQCKEISFEPRQSVLTIPFVILWSVIRFVVSI